MYLSLANKQAIDNELLVSGFKPDRAMRRKLNNDPTLHICDCIKVKEPTQIERTYKLLNDYFEVIRITNKIENSNGKYSSDEEQLKVVNWCREQLVFVKYNIQCGQKLLAKSRLTNITNKLDENNIVNLNLLKQLRSLK